MKDIEKLLRDMPLKSPPPNLVRRVEATFAKAAQWREPWYRRPVPLWKAAAACLVVAITTFGLSRALTPKGAASEGVPTAVYIIDAGSVPGSNVFDRATAGHARPPKRLGQQRVWLGEIQPPSPGNAPG